jgi:hypothetical protein
VCSSGSRKRAKVSLSRRQSQSSARSSLSWRCCGQAQHNSAAAEHRRCNLQPRLRHQLSCTFRTSCSGSGSHGPDLSRRATRPCGIVRRCNPSRRHRMGGHQVLKAQRLRDVLAILFPCQVAANGACMPRPWRHIANLPKLVRNASGHGRGHLERLMVIFGERAKRTQVGFDSARADAGGLRSVLGTCPRPPGLQGCEPLGLQFCTRPVPDRRASARRCRTSPA